ncbi:MAG: hypothetical protein WC560_11125 [Syntrophales bacterium]
MKGYEQACNRDDGYASVCEKRSAMAGEFDGPSEPGSTWDILRGQSRHAKTRMEELL